MLKSEIIENILDEICVESAEIVRVYGVPCGVGYDLDVLLNNGRLLNAHATLNSWGLVGHLKPDNPPYKYTGKCDIYQDNVLRFWESGRGLKTYLSYLKKEELLNFYNEIKERKKTITIKELLKKDLLKFMIKKIDYYAYN